MTEHADQQDIFTERGRHYLYAIWFKQQCDQGTIEQTHHYTAKERETFFAQWMRDLLAQKRLDPRHRLPPYQELAKLFNVDTDAIARVIRQLRDEKLLPSHKVRKDAGIVQWTPRDDYCLEYIGQMRAMRFDQLRRLLARESEYEIEKGVLSISRTAEIMDRWEQEKLAVYRRVYHAQPGWVYLTHRGLRHVTLDYRAEPPSSRLLHHLYWITEVRLNLEDAFDDTEMAWKSERAIQSEQEKREKGRRLKHIPDGILLLKQQHLEIDIEVQISKPSPYEVQQVMSDQFWQHGSNNPLRYYVNSLSAGVVRAVYRLMQREGRSMRSSIEIIDLYRACASPLSSGVR